MNTSRSPFFTTSANPGARRGTRRGEAIAVAVSLAVIALLATIDVVHSAPADAPIVQATFDVAPPIDVQAPQTSDRYERWAADESAQGTRPDGVH